MNQEERKLLLKDLCGRLTYVTYVRIIDPTCLDKNESVTEGCVGGYSDTRMCQDYSMDEIFEFTESGDTVKPYLRPMSSMTKEECEECMPLFDVMDDNYIPHEEWSYRAFDWLNEHHFDYRNLIGKGLALVAPEDMYQDIVS